MKLTVVGCSGSFPGPDSPASCYLLEHDGRRLLLDLGNGAFGALQRYADPDAVDAVVLSHLHADHCIDMTSYFVQRRWRPGGSSGVLPVLGPEGSAARLARAYDLPPEPGMGETFTFRDHVEVTEVGPFRITTARVAHPVTAFAVRVEAGGRSVVYSGDTGPCDALVELSRGADLALYEASFLESGDNPPDLHLTAAQAAEHAKTADVARLLLTHLVPWNPREASEAEASSRYDGDLVLASCGLTLDV